LPPVVLFIGFSDTGKTTLVESLVCLLVEKGHRVAAIKHSGRPVSADPEGTDTWRFSRAGAHVTMLASPGYLSVNRNIGEVEVDELVSLYAPDASIVLVEGFKHGDHPKIEVHRRGISGDLLCRGKKKDPHLVAVVSDEDMDIDVPLFDPGDAEGVCDLIEKKFLGG